MNAENEHSNRQACPESSEARGSAIECPNCGRPTTGGLYASPPVGEVQCSTTHCGCYHDPQGGERYTAERDTIFDSPNDQAEL